MSLNIVEEDFEFAKIIWTKMKVRNQEKNEEDNNNEGNHKNI